MTDGLAGRPPIWNEELRKAFQEVEELVKPKRTIVDMGASLRGMGVELYRELTPIEFPVSVGPKVHETPLCTLVELEACPRGVVIVAGPVKSTAYTVVTGELTELATIPTRAVAGALKDEIEKRILAELRERHDLPSSLTSSRWRW